MLDTKALIEASKTANHRWKNWVFYAGLICVFFMSLGVEPSTFSSWAALRDALLCWVASPYRVACTVGSLISIYANPTTKGIKD